MNMLDISGRVNNPDYYILLTFINSNNEPQNQNYDASGCPADVGN